uniref:meprin A subunit beta-like n=1 Tax=Styela clava TaxID=7725 RepID=UPI00193AA50F|nr:meprin A subunit beta-like [Styela clava]
MRFYYILAAMLLACEARQLGEPLGGFFENGRIEEAQEKKDIFEINKGIKGLVHGDVIPRKSKDTKNTARNEDYLWTSTNIPFVYFDGLQAVSLEAIGSIELARQEYKLRTCLNFYERTDEPNYIRFVSAGGCFSSVGMVGGFQRLSIGSGCERMAVCCHELMHAIGIWHEQSRADRDDYVEIMWDIISEGYENNFNKYDWEITDARRVPYDYNSIMHYSDSGFSTTGDPTIVTRDPAFQDIIGQRLTFSKGDTDKINRMYKCSDTLLYSYNCNYDDEAACGYVQDYDGSDEIDWIRYDVGDKSLTVSPNAPTADATLGVAGKGSYMILDNSGKTGGQMGEMRSMRFVTKSDVQCLQFSYYLDIKDTTGTAAMTAFKATLDDVTGEVIDLGQPLHTFNTSSDNKWRYHRMSINAESAYRIVFQGKTGPSDQDVIAIDDVSVQDKPCEDDYFVVDDYNNKLNTFAKGEFYTSPVLESDEGYYYKVKVYPVGTTSSATGYMGMFFGLVAGPNDDTLSWPFCNKYIRLMVVDQSDNPLYSLNKYAEYLTTQAAGGDLWNQPTSETDPEGYYGYSNFMPINDVTSTHHYLKHDSIMVSVLVKDMNWVHGDVCNGTFTRSTEKSAKSASHNGVQPGIDYIENDDYDKDYRDDDHHEHHDDEHHHENHEEHHEHHEGHHEHHEEHHEQHDHDHDSHDDQDDDEAMISVGAAAGMAVGSATFVFLVMASVLCCVQKSHKQNMKHVANNITLHTSTPVPPAYPSEGKITFEPLPEKI